MNKLVLIGNGFDLAHGLKTKYSDFLLWYLNSAINTLSFNHTYKDELIELNTIASNTKYPELSSIQDFGEYISRHEIGLKTNNSFVFSIILLSRPDKWVDIERQYYLSLLDFYHLNNARGKDSKSDLISLNNSFDFIKSKLNEYLLTVGLIFPTNDEIRNHFIHELFDQKVMDETNDTLFLNFNYTSTIELYIDSLSPDLSSQIIYIHGKLNDTDNPIIFGYGDEMDKFYEEIEQLDDNDYTKNIKSFAYLKTGNYQKLIRFISSGRFDVYIMGHSCGLSDRILLNSIFEHEECRRIKIFYYQKNYKEDDFFEKTQEISRHFRPISKGMMRVKIVPKENCSPLINFNSI